MQIGFIGLGKMGKGLVLNLRDHGHEVIAWNRSLQPLEDIAREGIATTTSLPDLIERLSPPRILWLMLPAGQVTEDMLFGDSGIVKLLSPHDIVIDGANAFYKDSIRHAAQLKDLSINFIDAGVSGGPGGARNGACIMVGGDQSVVTPLQSLFEAISLPGGYLHCGSAGAGHFVKMVHNGIEYGMMQAIGEGFEILKRSEFKLDLPAVSNLYNHGSVIESRLVGWLASAYQQYTAELNSISGSISHSGEGEWTVKTAKEFQVPAPVIEASFNFRLTSQKSPSYTGQVVSALRNQFGGHDVSDSK